MSIVIYYLSPDLVAHRALFEDAQFSAALDHVKFLRDSGQLHVCMSNEPSDLVGKMGVTSVENGKTPDGHDYDWKKRRV